MWDTRRIRELLDKLPDISPTAADLDAFAEEIGIPVPDDLRDWLKLASGPSVPSRLFGIRMRMDIESILEIHPLWKQNKWIPVADDGCGNYYVVATQQEFGKGFPILFIDTMESSEQPQYLVASDIGHFILFFVEHEINPRFDSEGWPFGEKYVLQTDPDILNFKKELLPWVVNEKSRGM